MAKAESLLEQAGAIDLTGYKGPTGLFSYDKEDAIKDFQAGNNLTIDGKIMPNGQTMRALKAQLTAPVKVTPAEPPKSGDIFVLVPKPRKGETLNRAAFRKSIRPLVKELNRELPESGTGDTIHNFGKHLR